VEQLSGRLCAASNRASGPGTVLAAGENVQAFTDQYFVELGDFGRDHPPMRPIVLTRYDGAKTLHGVIDGVVLKLPLKRVYSSPDRQKFKRSQLMALTYVEVV
jgi:hypothetical protein